MRRAIFDEVRFDDSYRGNAYREESVEGEEEGRTVLRLHPSLAPIKAAVFALTNKNGMPEMAHRLANELRQHFPFLGVEPGERVPMSAGIHGVRDVSGHVAKHESAVSANIRQRPTAPSTSK